MSRLTLPIQDDFMRSGLSSPQLTPPASSPIYPLKPFSFSPPRSPSTASLKSSLKSSSPNSIRVSSDRRPTVRFVDPDSSSEGTAMSNIPPVPAPLREHVPTPRPKVARRLGSKLSKRLSAPTPVGRDSKRTSDWNARPLPRTQSAPVPVARATSKLSVSTTQSLPALPSDSTRNPQPLLGQYNPLRHYIPCLAANCTTHYTTSTFGPTYHSPQAPYNLIRKRGFCPHHANRDLKAANEKCKRTWESMRQNAGRKTLGLIAAEFEIWLQGLREEREVQSKKIEQKQSSRVLGDGPKKRAVKSKPSNTNDGGAVERSDWDWRYHPRPCTKESCQSPYYSPFDNRLYLFYTAQRKFGITLLSTLCPSCAKADIEEVEARVEDKRRIMDDQPLFEWMKKIKHDRTMEQDFWEKAQERAVGEKRVLLTEATKESSGEKKGDGLKDLCVVM